MERRLADRQTDKKKNKNLRSDLQGANDPFLCLLFFFSLTIPRNAIGLCVMAAVGMDTNVHDCTLIHGNNCEGGGGVEPTQL